jgi:Tfp pilus assembly major pilin PilA
MVVISILAAIAIPKFSSVKDKAYVAAMKSDLRNLATYEESFAADSSGLYFSGTASGSTAVQGFSASQNVTVTATASGPPASWSATATHNLTSRTCSASSGGIVTCT